MSIIDGFSSLVIDSADYLWNGHILVSLLLGGGFYFLLRSRFIPLIYFFILLKFFLIKSQTLRVYHLMSQSQVKLEGLLAWEILVV